MKPFIIGLITGACMTIFRSEIRAFVVWAFYKVTGK